MDAIEASTSCKGQKSFLELSYKQDNCCNDDDYLLSDAEYYDNLDNGLGDDWDPSQPLEPLIPIIYSSAFDSISSDSMSRTITEWDIDSDADADAEGVDDKNKPLPIKNNRDALEVFFNTVIDEELEGEITIIQWISALKEIDTKMSEKQMYQIFNHIDIESQGYMDSVDFVSFCTGDHEEKDADIDKLQKSLTDAIAEHPFMINATRMVSAAK